MEKYTFSMEIVKVMLKKVVPLQSHFGGKFFVE